MMGKNIGWLAAQTGVKIPTIRYYEEIGLLKAAERTASNRRLYGEADRKRLSFIRHARDLGFEVEDIRTLLALSEQPQASCHEADSIAQKHLVAVEQRISQLQALRSELQRMIAECGHGRVCDCRILEVLADHGECSHHHAD